MKVIDNRIIAQQHIAAAIDEYKVIAVVDQAKTISKTDVSFLI
jgi:hypothetical protein